MKLEKIEIQGFKSFYDYQVLDFKPGVTGIVGPNGCGKSNISDAISWVLGTQSAAQLRGKRMDDLIFNGSKNRKPLGMAQVKMRMRSENGEFPGFDEDTIEIGRRLFRTGESDYLLNGSSCRLKDIQELIMDTGLGTTAYTVIEQGKIDQILSTKGTDRRELLEEAAGITRFKAKRHQTDLKLQATYQNLLRLHDIMQEIEKQTRTLARQAGKARRYRRLREETMDLRLMIYINDYIQNFSKQEDTLRRLSGLQDYETKTATALASKEAETEELKIKQMEDEEKLNRRKEKLFNLELKVNNLTAKREEDKRRVGEARLRISQNKNRIEEFRARKTRRRDELEIIREEQAKLRDVTSTKKSELDEYRASLTEEKNNFSGLDEQYERINKEHLDIIGKLSELQALYVRTTSELEQESKRTKRNRAEFEEIETELETLAGKHKKEERNLRELAEEIEEIKSDKAIKSGKAKGKKEELVTKSSEIEKFKENITRLQSEIETMKTLQWAEPGKFSAGEYLLELEKEGKRGLEGYLLENITVPEKFRKGIERYLEDYIRYFIVTDTAIAREISEQLKGKKKGRAAFYIRELLEARAPYPTLEFDDKPGVISSLHREVKGRGEFAYLVSRLFPDAYIVESLDENLLRKDENIEADIISLDGDVLFHQGVLLTGEDEEDAEKLLDLQALVRDKEKELEVAYETLTSAEAEKEKIIGNLNELESEIRELDIRQIESDRRHSVLDEKVRSFTEESGRLESKREVLESEALQIERDRKTLEENKENLLKQKNELEEKKTSIISEMESVKDKLEQARKNLDSRTTLFNEMQVEYNHLNSELRNLTSRFEHNEQNLTEIDEQIHERNEESENAEKLINELSGGLKELESEIFDLTEELEKTRDEVKNEEISFKNLQGQVIEGEQFVKNIRKQHEEELKAINELEIKLTEISVSLKNIEGNCQRELGRTLTEYINLFHPQEIEDTIDEVRTRLQELEMQITALGEVNLTAFEEYEKAKERLEFYKEQEADLNKSIESLEKAIDKLEVESRKRFRDAFEEINRNFIEIYEKLFEGGRAELSLPEGEDILECQINISAQPPGKRLQSISLLSGGEKAMTSIALLFGIFRFKPSPFCLLDEVDATLDEVNTGRFIKMIREYSDNTQFLLITHNKRTMETAQVLYGVTMEEPGVSKLVSVSFIDDTDSLKAAR